MHNHFLFFPGPRLVGEADGAAVDGLSAKLPAPPSAFAPAAFAEPLAVAALVPPVPLQRRHGPNGHRYSNPAQTAPTARAKKITGPRITS
jgi:hypothetical protein